MRREPLEISFGGLLGTLRLAPGLVEVDVWTLAEEWLDCGTVAGMEDAGEQPGSIMVEFEEPSTQFGQEESAEGGLLLCGGEEEWESSHRRQTEDYLSFLGPGIENLMILKDSSRGGWER